MMALCIDGPVMGQTMELRQHQRTFEVPVMGKNRNLAADSGILSARISSVTYHLVMVTPDETVALYATKIGALAETLRLLETQLKAIYDQAKDRYFLWGAE